MTPQARLIMTLLEKKKSREDEGLFVLEGEKLVEEGFKQIKFIVYSQNLPVVLKAIENRIQTFKISKEMMGKITSVESPPGIMAVAKIKNWTISDLLAKPKPLILFASEIQDPGNLGTMIRVLDAVNASGLISSRGTADHYNPKVVRSTMGSILRVPIVRSQNMVETIEILKKNRVKVVGTDLSAKKYHWDADLSGPTVLLVGNESAGLSNEALKLCNETVKIPMPGRAESLNAAQAATLMLYEALRQRTKND